MRKEIKYYVIGGQYYRYNYGGAATLEGAKRLASKNMEHWDNWQGWHYPDIYDARDCSEERNFFGLQMLPNFCAVPRAWRNQGEAWSVRY